MRCDNNICWIIRVQANEKQIVYRPRHRVLKAIWPKFVSGRCDWDSKRKINNFEKYWFPGYCSLPRSTMSEPLGCSDHFCQESAIPCLETVSEEARRQTGTTYDSKLIQNHKFSSHFITQPDWTATKYPIIISAIHSSIRHLKADSQIMIVELDQSVYNTTIWPPIVHHFVRIIIIIICQIIRIMPPPKIITQMQWKRRNNFPLSMHSFHR